MFLNPERIVSQLGLTTSMKVADLGAGTGAYSFAIAPLVTAGTVYTVEVQKGLVGRIKEDANKKHITNIECIWGDIETLRGTKIADNIIDLVIASNILFQVEHKDGFINEIARITKHGGKVLLIDWNDSFNGMGPAKNFVVTKERAIQLFERKGFQFESYLNAGEHHYAIIFRYK